MSLFLCLCPTSPTIYRTCLSSLVLLGFMCVCVSVCLCLCVARVWMCMRVQVPPPNIPLPSTLTHTHTHTERHTGFLPPLSHTCVCGCVCVREGERNTAQVCIRLNRYECLYTCECLS